MIEAVFAKHGFGTDVEGQHLVKDLVNRRTGRGHGSDLAMIPFLALD
jgi:hypothetical protein